MAAGRQPNVKPAGDPIQTAGNPEKKRYKKYEAEYADHDLCLNAVEWVFFN
jgi:hypothetical protein